MPHVPKPPVASQSDVDAFLTAARRAPPPVVGRGRRRLIFALDATMSRQPTWDLAQGLQMRMFDAASQHGGLAVQLVYFRGFSECRASPFVDAGRALSAFMSRIDCRSGHTQIGKVLRHARDETNTARVGALIFVGDAMEENDGELFALAGELGLMGTKAFMFQEGHASRPEAVFREIARLTGGAYGRFDASAPAQLAALLAAAAAYAAGGRAALEKQARDGAREAQTLLGQIG